jgi:hypothetical protein
VKIGEYLPPIQRNWEEALIGVDRVGGPSPWGNSRWGVFRSCPYLYWWMFEKRMKLIELDDALSIGGCYHELRAWYYEAYLKRMDSGASPEELDEACAEAVDDLYQRVTRVNPYVAGEAKRLLNGWMVLYGPRTPNDDRTETYEVECLLEVHKPFEYSCRLDRWYWSPVLEGAGIMEIKTSKKRDSFLVESYRFDPQLLGQMYLWRRRYQRRYGALKSLIIDLAVKSAPPSYHRETVSVDWKLVDAWEKSMLVWNRELQVCVSDNKWPQRQTYSCRYCHLFRHCASNKQDDTGWRKKKKGEY